MLNPGQKARHASALLGAVGLLAAVPAGAGAQVVDPYYEQITQPNTGKVVSFNTGNLGFVKNHSFTGVFGVATATLPSIAGGAYAFGAYNTAGVASATSQPTSNNPHGVTVVQDPDAPANPIIVTAQTRTSTVAVFRHLAGAPSGLNPSDPLAATDDILTNAENTPVTTPATQNAFFRVRTPRADNPRQRALVASYGASDGLVTVIDLNPLSLTFKKVIARLDAPGAVDIAVDEAGGFAYVGTFGTDPATPGSGNGDVLVFNLKSTGPGALNTSSASNKELNQPIAVIDTVTADVDGTGPDVVNEDNSRPNYDPIGKRVYTANYNGNSVSVIDVDSTSATFNTVIQTIELPDAQLGPDALSIDAARGLDLRRRPRQADGDGDQARDGSRDRPHRPDDPDEWLRRQHRRGPGQRARLHPDDGVGDPERPQPAACDRRVRADAGDVLGDGAGSALERHPRLRGRGRPGQPPRLRGGRALAAGHADEDRRRRHPGPARR